MNVKVEIEGLRRAPLKCKSVRLRCRSWRERIWVIWCVLMTGIIRLPAPGFELVKRAYESDL